ncbi:hypothetical protein [Nonomuraea sp. NEAU-A123]|uniref:hypothetical protein n=1 Tax=Nonomuraea sp. NEAU-A123 TaxID=2839649 RepID=UPI001BE4C687|nr:hypothetical protein [Nonomuraea sp. NEAU-A123]MBT2226225.1 hypothetical protein [Nonomuraea sp. NEAU-A123]
MKPNAREVTRCEDCKALVFFAVTKGGERQCLDVEPDPLGTVAAYRVDVRVWWCRTITAAAEADQVAHPLETRFRVHAATCRRRPRAKQGEIPFDAAAASLTGAGGVVVPFRRRR